MKNEPTAYIGIWFLQQVVRHNIYFIFISTHSAVCFSAQSFIKSFLNFSKAACF